MPSQRTPFLTLFVLSLLSWALPTASAQSHSATNQPPREQTQLELRFGVYTTDKPTVMYRTFTPILEALEESMAKEMNRDVAIELKIFKTYEAARAALVNGEIDFARFGPASYVLVKMSKPEVSILAMETSKGKKTFEGYIVVRADSPIRTIEDLRGRSFAFGDATSTIGRFLAQKELLDAGIHRDDLRAHDYLGRHDKVFRAVELGKFDAGALKSGTFNKLNKKGHLRILARFDNVTKPWVGRAGLGKDAEKALSNALIGIDDPELLAPFKTDKLVTGTDSEYDAIRESMKASVGFERPAAAPRKD